MSWTDERIELLKKRWADGHSASQIAAELGGVTRNAVIGKVHRLKLESRLKSATAVEAPLAATNEPKVRIATVAEAPAPAVAAPVVQEPAAPVPHLVASAPAPTMARPAMQPTARAVGATALKMEEETELAPAIVPEADERQSAEIVPISRNLTLVQLSERTCKWPLGDPLSPDFRFCGNHSGDASPYCQYHARLAFQPVSERRRVR